MKSKKPPNPRIKSGAAAPAGDSEQQDEAIILDFVQSRIEAFNQKQGGGVSVRKDLKGYTLLREATAKPVARLRAKDNKGNFEVLYWNPFTGRWRQVGTILSLDDALAFIADDPMDCFWR